MSEKHRLETQERVKCAAQGCIDCQVALQRVKVRQRRYAMPVSVAERNALRDRLRESTSFAHHWLVHHDGSECPDGCMRTADVDRVVFFYSEKEEE